MTATEVEKKFMVFAPLTDDPANDGDEFGGGPLKGDVVGGGARKDDLGEDPSMESLEDLQEKEEEEDPVDMGLDDDSLNAQ